MDYSAIIQALQSASLFDLYRLQAAIGIQLEDPTRIEQLRVPLRQSYLFSVIESHVVE